MINEKIETLNVFSNYYVVLFELCIFFQQGLKSYNLDFVSIYSSIQLINFKKC